MPGSFVSRDLDQPVDLQDRASGTAVSGRLETARLFAPDAGGRELVLTIWFDYPTWRRIDRAHHFGYTFESIDRDGFQGWELSSGTQVQLELRAEPAALAALGEHDDQALLDRAVATLLGDDVSAPLRDVASYRYLAVYQQKQQGGVSFLTGFTSVYRQRG